MKKSPSDIREMLAVLREFGVSEDELREAAINAAKEFGISLVASKTKCDSVSEFLQVWKAGEIPLPLTVCRSCHLYQAYQLWCSANGCMPITEHSFSCNLTTLGVEKFRRNKGTIIDPTGETERYFGVKAGEFEIALEKYRESLRLDLAKKSPWIEAKA